MIVRPGTNARLKICCLSYKLKLNIECRARTTDARLLMLMLHCQALLLQKLLLCVAVSHLVLSHLYQVSCLIDRIVDEIWKCKTHSLTLHKVYILYVMTRFILDARLILIPGVLPHG